MKIVYVVQGHSTGSNGNIIHWMEENTDESCL